MTRFAALGDSITAGMGDPAPGRGWAALLASTLPQPELHNLATLGALAADVERAQLPAATALRPDVASVVVGINDTLRGDFDPERTGHCVDRTVAALESPGLERVNLNVLSKPSGNLQLYECWPSARLNVRNRFSKRNEKT
jgi:lysophospholipase L1-like esterase